MSNTKQEDSGHARSPEGSQYEAGIRPRRQGALSRPSAG